MCKFCNGSVDGCKILFESHKPNAGDISLIIKNVCVDCRFKICQSKDTIYTLISTICKPV